MKTLLVKLLFLLARICLSRGMLIGQYFQNKGILLLSGVKQHRDRDSLP